jgi:hypothetical protein
MKYLHLTLCFFVWSYWQEQSASQDINDRRAEYQLEKEWADEDMAVIIGGI